MFEIERVGDRERKIGYSLQKGTETLVRDRERFEIEGVRDREPTVTAQCELYLELNTYEVSSLQHAPHLNESKFGSFKMRIQDSRENCSFDR